MILFMCIITAYLRQENLFGNICGPAHWLSLIIKVGIGTIYLMLFLVWQWTAMS
jgi:hypothetical protein